MTKAHLIKNGTASHDVDALNKLLEEGFSIQNTVPVSDGVVFVLVKENSGAISANVATDPVVKTTKTSAKKAEKEDTNGL